jgi:hypothetical protein
MNEGDREAAFYCISSRFYFLGAVGLINSLRLVGHTEPIFVLDCGLDADQRELLEGHVTVVSAPAERDPFMLKTVAPAMHPAATMVLIDADMLVTRPLTELIRDASEGRVIAFEQPLDRYVPEWGDLLDSGPARRQQYVSSALVALGGTVGSEVIALMEELHPRVEFERTVFGTNLPEHPYLGRASIFEGVADYAFYYADQDLLNAILATRVDPGRVAPIPDRLAATPPFDDVASVDERTLRCAYADGTEPYVLHHYGPKPWIEPTHHGVFSRLLRRLLVADDVEVKVPESKLPLRMRKGVLALAERKRVNARERIWWHVGEPLSSRLRALRHRTARAER